MRPQRPFRLALLFALAAVVAQGRLHWKSVLIGGVSGLLLPNAPAFYLGLTPNGYPPYLSGWLGDKNVAGFYYAALLWLTGSRTGIATSVAGLAWWVLRNRIGLPSRLVAFGAGVWLLGWFEGRFSQVGALADRVGTNLLREAIHAAAQTKIVGSAWYGGGFTTTLSGRHAIPTRGFTTLPPPYALRGIRMMATMLLIVAIMSLGLFSPRRGSWELTSGQ